MRLAGLKVVGGKAEQSSLWIFIIRSAIIITRLRRTSRGRRPR